MHNVIRYKYPENIFVSDKGELVEYDDYNELKTAYEALEKKYNVLADRVKHFLAEMEYFKERFKQL